MKRELKKSISWEIVKGGILSLKGELINCQPNNKLDSEIRSGNLFWPPLASRYRKTDESITESISSKSEVGDKISNEKILGNLENSALRELERELCK